MAGPAGFKSQILVNGVGLNFKTARLEKLSPFIEGSSKFNPDGSVNLGFTAKYRDLVTAMIEAEGLFGLTGGSAVPALANGENPAAVWSYSFDGVVLASGVGLYAERYTFSGSVPGEARASVLLYSHGPWS